MPVVEVVEVGVVSFFYPEESMDALKCRARVRNHVLENHDMNPCGQRLQQLELGTVASAVEIRPLAM